MSGAAEAASGLQTVLAQGYERVWKAGKDFAASYANASKATELEAVMAAAIQLILAAEFLHEVAETAAKDARTQLALEMDATGAPPIHTAHHTAYLQRKPAFVSVDDEKAIPSEYWTTPAPAPDKRRIKHDLELGVPIDGCSLGRPNSQTLVIKARQSA